jgi:hypothetical protein
MDLWYTRERERERRGIEEREELRGREPWGYATFILLQAGPDSLIDDDGDISMSRC